MVRPEKLPGRIVADYMTTDEVKLMVGFLIGYQKGDVGWDTYRLKIPDALLTKFDAMRKECWKNGFINPIGTILHNGTQTILWSQVLSNVRGDKCTFCTNLKCDEKVDAKGDFKPCWKQ